MHSGSGQHDERAGMFEPDDAGVAATPASTAAVQAVRELTACDVAALSDDECLGVFDQLEIISRFLAATSADVLAEIDARDLCDRRYGTTSRVWWERRHGRSRKSVGRAAAVARKLRAQLPELAQALADGSISLERVELIASRTNHRNADAIAAAQQALLTLSEAEPSFAAFAALIDDLARYADPDGAHDPDEPASSLTTHRTGSETVVNGAFVGPDGLAFEELLNAATDGLWRRWAHDLEQCPELRAPSRSELRAQALLELVRRGSGATPGGRPVVTELSIVIDADRTDGLDPILAAALNGTSWASPLNPFHDDNCASNIGPGDIIGMPAMTEGGERVWFSARQWQLLVCNADISEVLLDRLGMPIAVRQRLRHPNRAMRRTLEARDGGCVFPGCDAPSSWCDAHHVIHYLPDGDTVTANLVLLCRRHHGIVHRRGWSIRLTPPASGAAGSTGTRPGQGLFTITTARGLQLPTQHRPRPQRAERRPERAPDRQPQLA